MVHAATVLATVGVIWKGWPQTVPSESLLSDWKNKADVCEQLSPVVKDNGRKTSQNVTQLK